MSPTTEPAWFTSSRSGSEGDACVEVASCADLVHVRDSKDEDRARLALGPDAWARFVSHAARG
jgi:hypothetical protein